MKISLSSALFFLFFPPLLCSLKTMKISLSSALFFLFFPPLLCSFHAQQLYSGNMPLDCNTNTSSTLGYSCNGPQTSCSSYLVFRSQFGYQTPIEIAHLLNSDPSKIAEINGISSTSTIPLASEVVVPVDCSCSGEFYQHNSSYTMKYPNETYFLLANDTYEGLTTCQALMKQNPYAYYNLSLGLDFLVPLRCACPTRNQISSGVKYLLTYLITWGDDVSMIAGRFNSDVQSVLDANPLWSGQVIFPFTIVLVPLQTQPGKAKTVSPPPPLVPPAAFVEKSNKKWVFVGIGIGVSFLVPCGFIVLWFLCWHHHQSQQGNRIQEVSSSEDSRVW